MTFYKRFLTLCQENGTSPAAVARALGLGNSTTTVWKKGSIPKGDTLQKLADYFGVSVDYLLGKVNHPLAYVDIEKTAHAMGFEKLGELSPEQRVTAALGRLNSTGMEKAADAVEVIAEVPRYQAQERPKPPTEPQKGTDTTPAPDGSEGPQKRE